MNLRVKLDSGLYEVNTGFSWSLAIPLDFNQAQPNHFGAAKAVSSPMQAGGFIGDTLQGGSCNVNDLRLNPHCNGTHTETLAHICDADHPMAIKLAEIDIPPLLPCTLVSIAPTGGLESGDEYHPALEPQDKVISRSQLESALGEYHDSQLRAVAIRTLPNDASKRHNSYNENNQPAFLSCDAALYLNERGVEHLILDLPSVDRLHDDGVMSCHHLFWQVPDKSHQPGPNSLINKTITEMAYMDTQIVDGFYFLNLQTPAFVNDAAPSRPVLYPAQRLNNDDKKN